MSELSLSLPGLANTTKSKAMKDDDQNTNTLPAPPAASPSMHILYAETHATPQAPAFAEVQPAYIPTDSGYKTQWHLKNNSYAGMDLNVQTVWDEYKGAGVKVGILDDGFDYKHVDLAKNYNTSLDWDFAGNDADPYISGTNRHGTAVAGVIAADDNGTGTVGVAPDATLVGYKMSFGATSMSAIVGAFNKATADVDILNNSWGYTSIFSDNKLSSSYNPYFTAIENMAKSGRDGLGTVVVFSAGNSGSSGDNVNHHNTQNSPYTIAVGAIEKSGLHSSFSTPGSAVLVSAPGRNIYTTDDTGAPGYSSGDYASVSGTSFSAPATSGVIALMLDANANLGYRDVQEILAYSAKNSDPAHSGWQTNGSGNWNNSGLHFSHQYGFGIVDAYAAVRLAETWGKVSTFATMDKATYSATTNISIPDKQVISSSITVNKDIEIDHVLITVYLSHASVGHLQLTLVSPDGTESVLLDYPGATSGNTAGTTADMTAFEFSSVAHWGESSLGTWTLKAYDRITGTTGILKNWNLAFLGDDASNNDYYVYTNEYAKASNTTLSDSGGIDTINASAVTGNSTIDLTGATSGVLAGKTFKTNGAIIENAYTGDGNDVITGNASSNFIHGGRGNDTIYGSAGNDTLDGGKGTDTVIYALGLSNFSVKITSAFEAVVTNASLGIDKLLNFEFFRFGNQTYSFKDMVDYAGGITPNPDPTDPPPVDPPVVPPAEGIAPVDLSFSVLKTSGSTATVKMTSDTIGVTAVSSGSLQIGSSTTDQAIIVDRQSDILSIKAGDHVDGKVKTLTMTTGVTTDYDIAGIPVVNVNAQKAVNGIDLAVHDLQAGTFYTANGKDHLALDVENRDGRTSATYNTVRAYLYGGDDDMIVTGTNPAFKSLIDLGTGNDTYKSTATGTETIYGRAGNDTIETGDGIDKLYGHAGDDILRSGAGNDYLYGDVGNDQLYGGTGNDYLRGDAGNDVLYGEAGDDKLYGGTGNDILNGGAGNDLLDGGYDNDTLYTSDGIDSLRGGSGADTFVLMKGTGIDRIEDFSVTQKDKLDISNLLTGFDKTDDLSDFLRFEYNSSKGVTELKVNAGGLSGGAFETAVELRGNYSSVDIDKLFADGQIMANQVV